MRGPGPSVLALARSYPNGVFPALGLWVAQPTMRLAARLDMRVLSPVPWCPLCQSEAACPRMLASGACRAARCVLGSKSTARGLSHHPERRREYVLSRFGLPAVVERTDRNYLAVADARGRT